MTKKILYYVVLHLLLGISCLCTSLEEIMQQEIHNVVFQKFLNSTSVIGSSSSSSTSVIYRISTNEEFENFKKSDLSGKFGVVIQADLVNKKNLKELEATKKVEGLIIIYDETQGSIPYSPDKKCPNCEFGMYTEGERAYYEWNPYGDGLLYEYFNFPIFGLSLDKSDEANGVRAIIKADEFNKKRNYKKYPLYSVEFNSFMYAVENAQTCLSRGHCDPIGGNSIWGSYSKQIDPNDGKKIIIVSSQIDGNSLFHTNTIGTNSQIGGFVANLAIADALSKSDILPKEFPNHIVFTFFTGESYGYGGSQRFVKDITTYECKSQESKIFGCSNYSACQDPCMYVDDFKNITLNNIKGIIELNQLTCSGCDDINNPTYYMHIDDENDQETLKLTNLISKVYSVYGDSQSTVNNIDDNINSKRSSSYNIKPAWEGLEKNLGLPPASAQSFLKKQKIPAVVISDFQTKFTNKHYHSGFDVENESVKYDNTVCKTADIIAKSIWLYAQNKESDSDIKSIPESVAVDCGYVNDLMYCLSNNITCSLTKDLIGSNSGITLGGDVGKISHYSGVFNDYALSGAINKNYFYDAWIANYALIKSTGRNTTTTCKVINDCIELEYPDFNNLDSDEQKKITDKPYSLRKYQCILGYCIEGGAYAHPAYGVGIDYNTSKEIFQVTDENLPSWTETRWDEYTFTLTIYFVSSKTFQFIELLIGVLCIILTILGYFYIKNYVKKTMKIA